MAHTCKALILHCIDFRFGKAIKKYMEDHALLDDCDIVSVAGAAKNLAAPREESDRGFIMRQIETSKSLHEIKQVILMNHTDCGAYGGRSAFPSREEEEKKHFEDMQKALEAIATRYGDLLITPVLADITDSGEITFKEPKN